MGESGNLHDFIFTPRMKKYFCRFGAVRPFRGCGNVYKLLFTPVMRDSGGQKSIIMSFLKKRESEIIREILIRNHAVLRTPIE